MKLYTIHDLQQGVGVFNHVMEGTAFSSLYGGMSAATGIGFLASAMQSGLTSDEISEVIEDGLLPETADLLTTIREMYQGTVPGVHLWNETRRTRPIVYGDYLFSHCRPAWRAVRTEDPQYFDAQ